MDVNTRLSSRLTASKLKVGDIVTTELYSADSNVLRTITRIESGADTGTTFRAWATDGGVCGCCNKPRSKSINGVDAAWLIPTASPDKPGE